jgi:hypothetical protein
MDGASSTGTLPMSKLRLSSLNVSSFSTSLQLICQFVWAGEAPVTRGRVRLGRSWHKYMLLPEKTDVRNFDNAKVERAKAAARDIQSRESTTQWRLRSIKTKIFFLLTSVYNVHRSVRKLTITLLFSCGGAASVFSEIENRAASTREEKENGDSGTPSTRSEHI